jgi:hypothetical protein
MLADDPILNLLGSQANVKEEDFPLELQFSLDGNFPLSFVCS